MCSGIHADDMETLDIHENCPIAVRVKGKEHAIAVGLCKIPINRECISSKGVGITVVHHLGDELWKHEAVQQPLF